MSLPIDIPLKKSCLQGLTLDNRPFPEEDGPYMGYIEIYENGHVYEGISGGSCKFAAVRLRSEMPILSFIVEKDRVMKTTTIQIISRDLRRVISSVIPDLTGQLFDLTLELSTVLRHYDDLREEFEHMDCRDPYEDSTKEMRLLVDDLLLERALYDGVDIESLRQQGILSETHLRDIHQHNLDAGLDELQSCFHLGQASEEESAQYLKAQNDRITELALQGDVDKLRAFCEPLVRSQEIEVSFNPDLLVKLLDKALLEVYQYILDLVDRTTHVSVDVPNPDYSDITYHPFCVAIRLGHYLTVQTLVARHTNFAGYLDEDLLAGVDRVFTPLLAAVYWQRADIIPLLLASGPVYHASIWQAKQLAMDTGSQEGLQALSTLPNPPSASSPMNDKYPRKALAQYLHAVPPVIQPGSPPYNGDRSVSGITNSLNGSELGDRSREGSFGPLISPIAGITPAASSYFSSATLPDLSMLAADHGTTPSSDLSPFFTLSGLADIPANVGQLDGPPPVLSGAPMNSPMIIRHTSLHNTRLELGRASLLRLQQRCKRLAKISNTQGYATTCQETAAKCVHVQAVWKSGLESLRRLLRNEAPLGLVEVIKILLVADALICLIPHANELKDQFITDLRRWKILLDEAEMNTFDELVCTAWEIEAVPTTILPGTRDDTCRFGELVRALVSCRDSKPPRARSYGIRLRAIQRQMKSRERDPKRLERVMQRSNSQSEGSSYEKEPEPPDPSFDTDAFLREYVELDALVGDLGCPGDTPLPESLSQRSGLEVIEPRVTLLLESVAFTAVLTVASSIQDDLEDGCNSQLLARSPAGSCRSYAIVDEFLSFKSEDGFSYDSGIGMGSPVKPSVSRWMQEMREASENSYPLSPCSLEPTSLAAANSWPGFGIPAAPGIDMENWRESEIPPVDMFHTPVSLDPYQYADAFQSQESHVSATESSTATPKSPAAATAKEKPTCSKCGKAFSSISNRNKHLKEGCKFRQKVKHPCGFRHLGCTQELSTVWYRERHEQDRCPYNPDSAHHRNKRVKRPVGKRVMGS
ncbi:ankyrin repeat [Fusarium albosuccineum]|uniref:Ankyrin repeat n=1 Tax=Fusarium albosuccineum TaxID=1237068 RepID=A0A8H4PFR9_9HYPO|nr:ankyrin repeat [Fusarium albosuccineum]